MNGPLSRTRANARGSSHICIIRQSDVYELSLRREAEALVEAGYDVDVICMRDASRPSEIRIDGVTVLSVPISRRKSSTIRYFRDYLLFLIFAGAKVTERHLRRPYKIVQVNTMPDALVLAALAPKLLGARIIVFMKEPVPELGETLFGKGPLIRLLQLTEQLALRLADHVLTVTEELKARYVAVGAKPQDVTVVLNCPAAKNLRPELSHGRSQHRPEPVFMVVCHGSIEDRYGYDTILHAVKLAQADIPEIHLTITGRGSALDETLQLVQELDLTERVTYEGWVSQERLAEILSDADVGIVAQKASPYSHLVHTNKMVDYWVFGLPVIASRLRAVSAMFDDSVVEYFEPGDADSLARSLIRLRHDSKRREQLAINGRRAQAEHGWDVQKRSYLAVYRAMHELAGSNT